MMTSKNDVRSVLNKDWHLRDLSNDDSTSAIGQVTGYACVFNQPSEDLGFIEYCDPNMFDGVDMSNVLALYSHDLSNVLGRVSADTLVLKVDDYGLKFTLDIPDTTLGRDVYTNIKNGNLEGCSFGFTIEDDSWNRDTNGQLVHTILQIGELTEISITPLPAYTETSIAVSRGLKKVNEETRRQKASLFLDLIEMEVY
ncbi:HK97 family phage prohead protease [Pediococcus pentosaceus]|uniref:HK97 family phage prohead protease n=1 Tax=Pediococcus pentosaceus TaxID=1255 RepID=UPI0018A139B6|nr:HK97 family phage prohead protease [Pediococcus pentosaceus]MBF7102295.1 HK97 family phage prohead protease [Pediococcus pentosaceus]